MENNNFKSSLKYDVSSRLEVPTQNIDKTNTILSSLGLFPIPENVQVTVSPDGSYLNIKLKDSDKEKHLLFQFPLEELDYSELHKRNDYAELLSRYHTYINSYVDEIKKYSLLERQFLQEKFPNLVFNIKVRIKSFDSYMEKLSKNISNGKTPYIKDIIAERIILSSIKSPERDLLKEKYANNPEKLEELYKQDEQELRRMCDDVAKALYDFRINTNFRMKTDVAPNKSNSDKEYITKDYISVPKDNGYESIHIIMENIKNKYFTYETQIRTLEMESMSKSSGEIAHNKYKPRLLNDKSPNRIPKYFEVTAFKNSDGNYEMFEVPFENRFYHFFNSEKTDHTHIDKDRVPITYDLYTNEQYELEQALNMSFKDLSSKLRECSKSKNREFEK